MATLLVLPVPASAQTVTVTAEWDRNTDAVTAGYLLSYGTAPGNYQWTIDAGDQVSTPVTLASGSIYYFVVSAYDSAARFGPPSDEATIDLRATPTASVTASLQSPTTALVTWQTTNAVSATINGAAVALQGSTTATVTDTTSFTLIATGATGLTATSNAGVIVPVAPAPASQMSSQVSGGTVTLAWQAPTTGGSPQTYLLDIGTTSGGTNVAKALPVGNVLSVSGSLAKGRYYARVRAANASGVSGYSNSASFRIGKSLPTPTGFNVQWSGDTAVMTWTAAAADADVQDRPTSYVLETGSAPGLSDVATVSLGNVTRFQAKVPSGIYYVRLRAANAFGDSEPTPEIRLVPPGMPGAPTGLVSSASGAVVLSWAAPTGAAVTGYVIEAGSAPGLANLAVLRVGTATQFSTVAPPGTYYVRVRAQNGRGLGLPSNEVIVRR